MKINNKKGIELSNAFGAVLAVVLVAVLVIIAIFIFQTLTTGLEATQDIVVTNESGGFINGSGYTVDTAGDCNFGSFAVTEAFNATDETAIVAANYTVNADTGVIVNATGEWTTSDAEFNYTYSRGGAACTASEDMITQFATYPALVGLVGTIVFLGLVIGILVASFVFGGKRSV